MAEQSFGCPGNTDMDTPERVGKVVWQKKLIGILLPTGVGFMPTHVSYVLSSASVASGPPLAYRA